MWSKRLQPGGASPICSAKDVTQQMVDDYRKKTSHMSCSGFGFLHFLRLLESPLPKLLPPLHQLLNSLGRWQPFSLHLAVRPCLLIALPNPMLAQPGHTLADLF